MAHQNALTAFEDRFNPDKVAPGTFADDNDVVLFTHIPKTAGMSVGKALRQGFDEFHPVHWENVGQAFRRKSRKVLYERSHTPARRVMMGHFSWIEINFWKTHELPIKAAAILRDPLARVVSNYNYNCSAKHPRHEQFKQKFPTLDAYAENLSFDYQLNTLIGAFYSFDHALEKLTRYYSFLGLTEHLGASLEHFATSHGLPKLQEHRQNRATKPASEAQVSDRVRNIVLEKSHNDQRLFELLQSYYA